jgi:hypothetical protein
MANVESSQLGRSHRAVGVGDVWELLERLVPLAMNNLLVSPLYLKALIHHIFKVSKLVAGVEGEPPPWAVREGAAVGAAEEPARESLGSLGTAGRRES